MMDLGFVRDRDLLARGRADSVPCRHRWAPSRPIRVCLCPLQCIVIRDLAVRAPCDSASGYAAHTAGRAALGLWALAAELGPPNRLCDGPGDHADSHTQCLVSTVTCYCFCSCC
uniref:Uncharacterized protein n=1 Tax=Setaria viridis TaxID=4556 RepID=A0A4U6TSI1_SETVI|nr:hypothetical protein SEVIR_7G108400v2 [Setaria viridis]